MKGQYEKWAFFDHCLTIFPQEAQLSLTNRTMVFCKVVEVLQDVLSD